MLENKLEVIEPREQEAIQQELREAARALEDAIGNAEYATIDEVMQWQQSVDLMMKYAKAPKLYVDPVFAEECRQSESLQLRMIKGGKNTSVWE